MVCVRHVGGLLFGEYFLPCAISSFPKRSEMFEEFVGVVDGLASLSDYSVVLVCAHGTLDGVLSFFAVGCCLWLVRPPVLKWQWNCCV